MDQTDSSLAFLDQAAAWMSSPSRHVKAVNVNTLVMMLCAHQFLGVLQANARNDKSSVPITNHSLDEILYKIPKEKFATKISIRVRVTA
jgi:hypothetical protein